MSLKKLNRHCIVAAKILADYNNNSSASSEYFTIEALEDGLQAKLSVNACEYSLDGNTWNSLSAATNTPAVNTGDKIYFRGDLTPTSSSGIGTFTISKKCNLSGNIMSLLYGDNFEEQTDLTGYSYAFHKLFYRCTTIIDASQLILPATTLASYCYLCMFHSCSSLVNAPELPATTLKSMCYKEMFTNCTSLVNAPELPATTLASYCYTAMFSSCSSLVNAPELPATTLASSCYIGMFSSCSSLVNAPELPATTLAYMCYGGTYTNIYNIYVYSGMFSSCTSLTVAPELPATTLVNYCYYYMFTNCKSLVNAPELPATTLAYMCYSHMFYGCTKLNYIKALFTTTPGSSYTSNWVSGVSSTGTFVKSKDATWDVTGNDGIPIGWTVETPLETSVDYLTIEALEDDLTVSFSMNTIQYSTDNCQTWIELPADTTTPVINAGNMISFKATGLTPSEIDGIGRFTVNKKFNLKGNVMSMLFGDEGKNSYDLTGYDWAFSMLFLGCSKLQSVSENFLPATTLDDNCYWCMFASCTSLTVAPELPATTLDIGCYAAMFQYCYSLVTAPELPATTLADGCYAAMFDECTSLTVAPELPATTLVSNCYYFMFNKCSSLTQAPVLPATTLVSNCYQSMFSGCSKLNYIKALFTTTPSSNYTSNWVNGVLNTGTFVKSKDATWNVTGANGIPSGWTVETI